MPVCVPQHSRSAGAGQLPRTLLIPLSCDNHRAVLRDDGLLTPAIPVPGSGTVDPSLLR